MNNFKQNTVVLTLLLMTSYADLCAQEKPVNQVAEEVVPQAGAAEVIENYSEEFSVEKLKVKKYKFRIYKVLGKNFTNFCQLLEADGRRELFFNIFSTDISKTPDCPACKPFIVALKKGCAPKKIRKKKKYIKTKDKNGKTIKTLQPEEPIIPVKKQREAKAELVSYASDLFTQLAQDQDTGELTYTAFLQIEKLTKDSAGKTPAEQDYIKSLMPYISAVFFEYAEAEKQKLAEKKRRDEEETKWRFGKK